MARRLSAILLALGTASALALTGCAGTAAPAGTASADTIQIVASTNVYGAIAQEVGSDRVTVTSLVSSTSQDPHEYEGSARDQLTVSTAQLLVENGGGYDSFLDALADASGSTAPVVTAFDLAPAASASTPAASASASPSAPSESEDDHDHSGDDHSDEPTASSTDAADDDHGHDHAEGVNEHVFYDPATMALVANAIAEQLGSIDAAHATEYTDNAKAFGDGIAGLEQELSAVAAASSGKTVFVTEPLPLYLTEAAGLANVTPGEFSEAVEEGRDVPPATLLQALDLVPTVSVVITNEQAGGAETTQIEQAADAAGVPVIAFSELLPDGQTYLEWMTDNVAELAAAVGS